MRERTRQPMWVLAVLVVGALVAGSCSSDGGSDDTAPVDDANTPSEDDGPTVDDDESVASGDDVDQVVETDDADVPAVPSHDLSHLDELTRWAASFTGGPGTDTEGAPIRIGYVHDAEMAPLHLSAAIAAADYVNDELGGVDGRPIELVACDPSVPRIDTELDPETEEEIEVEVTCDVELADDDTLAVIISHTRVDTAVLYEALADIRPVLVASPGDVVELTSPSTTSYLAGTLSTGGIGVWALALELESAIALFTDNTAGRDGFTMLEPMFAAMGVELAPIWITATTNASRVESSLEAAGAAEIDLLIINTDEPGCVAAAEALAALDIDGTTNIIASASTCLRPEVRVALAESDLGIETPANWHFATNGHNPFAPTIESGHATLDAVLGGPLQPDHVGHSGMEAAVVAVLSAVRALNRAGDDLSFEAVHEALRNPDTKVPTQAGSQECGRSSAFEPVCAAQMGIVQFAGGAWIEVATGSDAIDLSQILFPPG